jgi:hypothetical protein
MYRLRGIEADAMVRIAKSRRITNEIDQLINPPGKGDQKQRRNDMARKAAPQVIDHNDIDDENKVVGDSAKEMAALSTTIVNEYGHGVPYSREHYLNKARGHIMRSAEEALELGRCLIVMKEHEPHGDWIEILTDLELERTFAARTMQAAIKFTANGKSTKNLIDAAKSKSKLFELMVLDNEQIEQLDEGQSVAGITLDDVEKMPVSELRKALREARNSQQDQDRVINEKNKKIDEQAKQIMRIRREPDEEAKQMRADISSLQSMVEHDIRVNLFNGIKALREHADQHDEPGSNAHQEFISSQITLLENAIAFLRENCVQGVEWE